MAQQNDLDRTEAATSYKLQKAHERGSIVKSAEVTFVAILFAATAFIYGLGESTLTKAADLLAGGLRASARGGLGAAGLMDIAAALGTMAMHLVAPILFVLWTAATLVAALQARGVFSVQPLKPDFNRLNPARALERIFSMKSVYDLLRNLFKLSVLAAGAWVWGSHHLNDIVGVHALTTRSQSHVWISLLGSVFGFAAALFVVFAVIDWLFNQWDYARQMRMSKREVKDEHKEREGDPRIKSRLRELRVEWLRRAQSVAKVKNADVLLANPTHYAVALEYRHGQTPAPLITAKGAGELALRMREEARRRNVPIVENPPLTRALFGVPGMEPFVPQEHFQEVARILRWVYARRRGRVSS